MGFFQTACFERTNCTEFTFFRGDNSRCVLFNHCSSPVSSCKSCISGPPFPRVSNCLSQPQVRKQINTKQETARRVTNNFSPKSRQRAGHPRSAFQRSNGPSRPLASPCVTCSQGAEDNEFKISIDNGNKDNSRDDQFDKENDSDTKVDREDDSENERDKTEDDDEVNIDDGLLDAVFDELPGTGNTRPPKPPRIPTSTSFPSTGGGFYYCIMGGSNANGPVSTVSVMNIGTYAVPRTPLISPFPSFMTQGSGRTFSVYSGNSLNTCTPGYHARTLLPASTFGPFFGHQSFVPGSCNGYRNMSGYSTCLAKRGPKLQILPDISGSSTTVSG